MDISLKDYEKITKLLTECLSTLEWKLGMDPVYDSIYKKLSSVDKIFNSYLDDDSIGTIAEQLELELDVPIDEDDEEGYVGRY